MIKLRSTTLLFALALSVAMVFNAKAQVITSPEIDALVEQTLKTFNVPGIAVGVVKDGKLIHAKGYGVRSIVTKEKVDEKTFYGIASNSKAFTTAALAMLVDEKKLNWDDKVRNYIPDFTLYDPFVSENFTIRDLVCHRSGLGLGSGDLMIWPDSNSNSVNTIIHNLRYLKPVSSFRSKFDYNNNLFVVAGEVIAKLSGMSWDEFIETRIMKPLEMNTSAASRARLKNKENITEPHAPVNGTLQVCNIHWSETANAAGGIYTNITDLSKWVIAQLNNGKYGEGLTKQLFSEKQQTEMWNLQTPIPVAAPGYYNTHFNGYGLGWFVSDVKGYKQVTHTGGLAGIVTQVVLIPELKLGIMVFTNQQVGAAFQAISNTIKDSYLGLPKKDWVSELNTRVTKLHADAAKVQDEVNKHLDAQKKNKMAKPDISNFTGKFKDNWYGSVDLTLNEKGQFLITSQNSKRMKGELFYYKANTYVVKWNDRTLDADAYVNFSVDKDGKATGFALEAYSPLTDFSFDFQDLEFKRATN
jgi:CubicO group peptidase (beta-lactamase class C family)